MKRWHLKWKKIKFSRLCQRKLSPKQLSIFIYTLKGQLDRSSRIYIFMHSFSTFLTVF